MFFSPRQFQFKDISLFKPGSLYPIPGNIGKGPSMRFVISEQILHINIIIPKISLDFGQFLQTFPFRCGVITSANVPYIVFDWGIEDHRMMGYFNVYEGSSKQLNKWMYSKNRVAYISYTNPETRIIKGFRVSKLPSGFINDLKIAISISRVLFRNKKAVEKQIIQDLHLDTYNYLLANAPFHIVMTNNSK